jgi:transcriptional regulator with XRE-family HTH domain
MLAVKSKPGQSSALRRHRDLDDSSLDADTPGAQIPAMSVYLRKWRLTLGFTLHELARKIGRHFSTIPKWELGINAVGMKELELLGAAYDVPAILLTLDPVDRQTIERMIRAHRILTLSDEKASDEWLRVGENMLPRKPDHEADVSPKRRK